MKKLAGSLAAFVMLALTGIAVADLAVKDGSGANATMFDFLCFTTKHCSASVIVTSAGVEVVPATHADMTSLITAVGSPIPAGANAIGSVTVSNFPTAAAVDPCQASAKTFKVVSQTTATTSMQIAGAAAKKTYICHLFLTATATDNVAVIEGTTGGTCGSGTAGIYGTAASPMSFSAQGGVSLGNGGYSVAQTATNQNDVCIFTSAATPLVGGVLYVQQ